MQPQKNPFLVNYNMFSQHRLPISYIESHNETHQYDGKGRVDFGW
jgi:hypothetical protein